MRILIRLAFFLNLCVFLLLPASSWLQRRVFPAGQSPQDRLAHLPTFISNSQLSVFGNCTGVDGAALPDAPCLFTTAASMVEGSRKRRLNQQCAVGGTQPEQQLRPASKKRVFGTRSGFVPPHKAVDVPEQRKVRAGKNASAGKTNCRPASDTSGIATFIALLSIWV